MENVPISDATIEKIQKLLALGTSPNENEAKLAMSMASELLTKYNLSMTELKSVEDEVTEEVVETGKNVIKWKQRFLNIVAKHHYCRFITNRLISTHVYGQRGMNQFKFVLIGKKHNILIAENMYNYLVEAIDRLTEEAGKSKEIGGRLEKNSFRYGLVYRLKERLDEIRRKREDDGINLENGTYCTALVVVSMRKKEEALTQDYLDANYGKIGNDSSGSSLDANAYKKGYANGDRIGLNPQVRGSSKAKRLN